MEKKTYISAEIKEIEIKVDDVLSVSNTDIETPWDEFHFGEN